MQRSKQLARATCRLMHHGRGSGRTRDGGRGRGNLSRSAIYVGGGTQLMFGIWGSRWVGRPDVKAIANEFWVHPSKSEVPSNAKKLEGAAYF